MQSLIALDNVTVKQHYYLSSNIIIYYLSSNVISNKVRFSQIDFRYFTSIRYLYSILVCSLSIVENILRI